MLDEHKRRVVVAEDDEALRELIVTRLTMGGYLAFTAPDGVQAIEAIKAHAPHGVILDIGMPNLDGFGVLNAIRTLAFKPPVLVLTARNAVNDMQRAMQLGAKDYMTKPFDEARLMVRVARLTRGGAPPAASGRRDAMTVRSY